MFLWTTGRFGADRLILAETYRERGQTRRRVLYDFGPRRSLTLDEVRTIAEASSKGDMGLRILHSDLARGKVQIGRPRPALVQGPNSRR